MQASVDTAPPRVSEAHPDQRYFTPVCGQPLAPKHGLDGIVRVQVYRNEQFANAELTIRVSCGELTARCDASELRGLAGALLSAAADLDALPARPRLERPA